MREDKIIDAEFEVITPRREQPLRVRATKAPREVGLSSGWTFWGDDFPKLVGIACAFAVALLLRVYTHKG